MAEQREALEKLLASLPAGECPDIGDQARAVLRFPLELALLIEEVDPVEANPENCPNCDRAVGSTRSPYCSTECREISGFVRQFRATLHTDAIFEKDKQIAFGQIFWRLLGGGLPFRNSLIEPKASKRLFDKYEGRCAECGVPATTVDHIGSHCNRTSNLRPVCERCATTRPFGDERVLSSSGGLLNDIAQRIGNERPIRGCDDAAAWDWRAYVSGRR